MIIFLETERLILRELLISDLEVMFELDSDPAVHQFLGNNPISNIEQAGEIIANVRQQYLDNGIGRWAMVEKSTNIFVGWCGLKLVKEETNNHINFYDIGYRLLRKHWGKGFAQEAAQACLNYGFKVMNLNEIYASADINNIASNRILQKIGLKQINTFMYDENLCNWYKIKHHEA